MFDFNQLLISSAWAQTAAPAAPGGAGTSIFMNLLPLVLIFAVFYILIIRPQQKKLDQHGQMLKALRRGDRVVTGGGIVGTVVKLEGDEFLIVEIADNVRVKILRSTVSTLSAKTEPVTAAEGDEAEKKDQ
jgi:preprotein translocase subunit YajC